MTTFRRLINRPRTVAIAVCTLAIALSLVTPASANPQAQIIAGYAEQVKTQVPEFDGFSADRGRVLFLANHATGKPETPSCTSCHTANPVKSGRTRAGKDIAPLALSKAPERYMDLKKVEKWFRRNCNSVLGRSCTALEKGDFLTFMVNQ